MAQWIVFIVEKANNMDVVTIAGDLVIFDQAKWVEDILTHGFRGTFYLFP